MRITPDAVRFLAGTAGVPPAYDADKMSAVPARPVFEEGG
jgi:hypothetical protein